MVGGIVCALAAGRPLRESVCYGIAAGSATVMNAGTELCHREDVERLFAEMKEPWNKYAMPGLGMHRY